jgi:hypothetical protein
MGRKERVSRGHTKVARKRQRQSSTDNSAVKGGDNRLRCFMNRQYDVHEVFLHLMDKPDRPATA